MKYPNLFRSQRPKVFTAGDVGPIGIGVSSHALLRIRTFAVDADDVATTDFDLSDDKKELLISNGRSAARRFLTTSS